MEPHRSSTTIIYILGARNSAVDALSAGARGILTRAASCYGSTSMSWLHNTTVRAGVILARAGAKPLEPHCIATPT
jgi:hypothetical protein